MFSHRSCQIYICLPLILGLFRREAEKLDAQVTIVSQNLGAEIRNELRWERVKTFTQLFGPSVKRIKSNSFRYSEKNSLWSSLTCRTSVDIMRVHEGVRRLRRKSSGLTTKETIGAIVEARQPGERWKMANVLQSTSEARLRRRRRRKKQESETFRHRSFLSARLMYDWIDQLAAKYVSWYYHGMVWHGMNITRSLCGDMKISWGETMCRYPQEMQIGSIGTTGEGRDIKVDQKWENI